CGTVTSAPFNVTVTPDNTAPHMVKAVVNATRTAVTVSFSEPLATPVSGDEFNIWIQETPSSPTLNAFDIAQYTLQNGSNIVIGLDPGTPWVEGTQYRAFDQGGGAKDACNTLASPVADISISAPVAFQDGLNGYTGTEDVELRSTAPDDTTLGASSAAFQVDGDPLSQTLIQFRNIFGGGVGQIPQGSTIGRATL